MEKVLRAFQNKNGIDADGVGFAALPRGFYLRASFTSEIVRQNYAL